MKNWLALLSVSLSVPAFAQMCTINPTFTATVGSRETPLMGEIAGRVQVNLAWAINATPDGACTSLSEGYDIVYGAVLAGLYPDIGPNGSTDNGTSIETPPAGRFDFHGSFRCGCGGASGPSQNIDVMPVIVAPTIPAAPPIYDSSFNIYQQTDTVPLGGPLTIGIGVDQATLCPGEKITYTVSGAGANASVDVFGPDGGTTCTTDTAAGPSGKLTFTPTTAGVLSFKATFEGQDSNVVNYNVGASGTGGGAGGGSATGGGSAAGGGSATGGGSSSGGGGQKSGGCSAVGAGGFALLALGLALRRRRGVTPARP